MFCLLQVAEWDPDGHLQSTVTTAVLENLKFLLEPLKLFLSRITQRASVPYNSNGDALGCLQCHDRF